VCVFVQLASPSSLIEITGNHTVASFQVQLALGAVKQYCARAAFYVKDNRIILFTKTGVILSGATYYNALMDGFAKTKSGPHAFIRGNAESWTNSLYDFTATFVKAIAGLVLLGTFMIGILSIPIFQLSVPIFQLPKWGNFQYPDSGVSVNDRIKTTPGFVANPGAGCFVFRRKQGRGV
jgi:hypothetical protein